MIRASGIRKNFADKKAINNLSFEIDDGIVGLVGENGAGKSTLLRLLSGVYNPDGGFIEIDGISNTEVSSKANLFFLPDDPYCPNGGCVSEIFRFYSLFYEIDEDIFYKYIRSFELPENKKVSTFSKGMRRQAFLSLCLAMKIKYLLLDEAFDGIDPLTMEKVKKALLRKRQSGGSIVIASHNIHALDGIADTFLLLTKGELGASGNKEDLSANLKKYQVLFKEDVTKEDIISFGLRLVSLKKVGSITHLIVYEYDQAIQRLMQAKEHILFEPIPIDADEILALSMAVAKEEENE